MSGVETKRYWHRWPIFIRERFSPLSYFPMVAVFLATHYALVAQIDPAAKTTLVSSMLLAVGVMAFFFMLRLYDEIKDYETDLKIHPTRPLPRGLVTAAQLKTATLACLITELICFGLLGLQPFIGMIIAIGYSLLMYGEFFASKYIRARLTTYAIIHTAVVVLLSLAIFSALSSHFIWQLSPSVYFFALSNWCLFNIFEFGRKTFSSGEEQHNVDSYSKIFGRFGAVCLVIIMAIISLGLLALTPFAQATLFWPYTILALLILSTLGIVYAAYNHVAQAKIYRAASSVYLLVVYGGLLISSLGMG